MCDNCAGFKFFFVWTDDSEVGNVKWRKINCCVCNKDGKADDLIYNSDGSEYLAISNQEESCGRPA